MFVIPASTTEYNFDILTTDDELFESRENFTVSLSIIGGGNGAVTGPRSTAVVTITDNDGR